MTNCESTTWEYTWYVCMIHRCVGGDCSGDTAVLGVNVVSSGEAAVLGVIVVVTLMC